MHRGMRSVLIYFLPVIALMSVPSPKARDLPDRSSGSVFPGAHGRTVRVTTAALALLAPSIQDGYSRGGFCPVEWAA